ncbi:metallophosphoesterase family protein [Rhodopseudomonas sp. B29]|uniref:metallophosphoesterase family protein n=1 Tax=Rhodopseudomonas sp. B29 TaxID=95607 RepID=UPI0003B6C136|nr:metallophosphoesterase family protein [Rhodopseudomonas sp. B29]
MAPREPILPRTPRLPDGIRLYAVGDIHGRADLLRSQLAQISADERSYHCRRSAIIFLGDYIDRGPDARGAIDLLLACARTREVIFLKGNHETFIRRFLEIPQSLDEWRHFGGLETLVSYGLRPSLSRNQRDYAELSHGFQKALPPQHLAFFDSLPLSYTCGDFLFVHAGVRPGVALHEQTEADLLWIRDDFLGHSQPFEKFIVHGHTPVGAPDLRLNRVNVDTGAFATGRLSCIAIEGTTIVPLSDIRQWAAGAATREQDADIDLAQENGSARQRVQGRRSL